MPHSVKQQLDARRREAKALELRAEGSTYADIASQLGYADAAGAHKAVQRALRAVASPTAEELVLLQMERLNSLLSDVWAIADDPMHPKQLEAVDAVLRVMDRMNRLVGL